MKAQRKIQTHYNNRSQIYNIITGYKTLLLTTATNSFLIILIIEVGKKKTKVKRDNVSGEPKLRQFINTFVSAEVCNCLKMTV